MPELVLLAILSFFFARWIVSKYLTGSDIQQVGSGTLLGDEDCTLLATCVSLVDQQTQGKDPGRNHSC